jgi:hypothetical protein
MTERNPQTGARSRTPEEQPTVSYATSLEIASTLMSWRTLPIVLTLLIAGCASHEIRKTKPAADEVQAKVEAIVERVAQDEYASSENCLSTFEYDSVDIIDERHLLFHGLGDDMWINQLRADCPGLHDSDTLLFELHSSRVCSLDIVRRVDRMLFWWNKGPMCSLGKFYEVSPTLAQSLDAG